MAHVVPLPFPEKLGARANGRFLIGFCACGFCSVWTYSNFVHSHCIRLADAERAIAAVRAAAQRRLLLSTKNVP
jgi:hypothetical protein